MLLPTWFVKCFSTSTLGPWRSLQLGLYVCTHWDGSVPGWLLSCPRRLALLDLRPCTAARHSCLLSPSRPRRYPSQWHSLPRCMVGPRSTLPPVLVRCNQCSTLSEREQGEPCLGSSSSWRGFHGLQSGENPWTVAILRGPCCVMWCLCHIPIRPWHMDRWADHMPLWRGWLALPQGKRQRQPLWRVTQAWGAPGCKSFDVCTSGISAS